MVQAISVPRGTWPVSPTCTSNFRVSRGVDSCQFQAMRRSPSNRDPTEPLGACSTWNTHGLSPGSQLTNNYHCQDTKDSKPGLKKPDNTRYLLSAIRHKPFPPGPGRAPRQPGPHVPTNQCPTNVQPTSSQTEAPNTTDWAPPTVDTRQKGGMKPTGILGGMTCLNFRSAA